MDALVQNLLKIARLDAGTTPMEKAEEPVAGLMESVRAAVFLAGQAGGQDAGTGGGG